VKRAIIYARVSTAEQAETGSSLDSQISAGRQYAAANGFMVLAEFREAKSGATLDRPRLDKVRDLAARGEVQAVICYEQDRLSRSLAQTYLLVEEFEKAGVELLFVTEPADPTPEGKMLFGMKGLFKEYERTKIRDRSRRGKEARAREGRVLGTQFAPYGYDYEVGSGKLVLIEEEAQIVQEIFNDVVKRGLSMYQVAKKLNERGVPTSQGGSEWRNTAIKSILRNPIYCGRVVWNKSKTVPVTTSSTSGATEQAYDSSKAKTIRRPRPESEWIVVEDPALRLISDETFNAVNGQLRKNQATALRQCKHEYLLRNLLVCGYCGKRMRGHITNKGVLQYECYNRDRINNPNDPHGCVSKTYNAAEVEQEVWAKVRAYVTDPTLLRQLAEHQTPELATAIQQAALRLIEAQSALAKTEAQADKLLDLYLTGSISKSKYEAKVQPIDDTKAQLECQIAELEQEAEEQGIVSLPAAAIWDSVVVGFCAGLRLAMHNFTFSERRRLLELASTRVSITAKEVHIRGAFTAKLLADRESYRVPFAHVDNNIEVGTEEAEISPLYAVSKDTVYYVAESLTAFSPKWYPLEAF
jgi:site-specific DNA recombinase